ncbi:MAG TPA: hypothetical protein VI432_02925 [Candidatus Paceibacterota bacterium]
MTLSQTLTDLAKMAGVECPSGIPKELDYRFITGVTAVFQFVKFDGLRDSERVLVTLSNFHMKPANVHQLLALFIEHRAAIIRLAVRNGKIDFHAVAMDSIFEGEVPVLSIENGPPELNMEPTTSEWTTSHRFPVMRTRKL